AAAPWRGWSRRSADAAAGSIKKFRRELYLEQMVLLLWAVLFAAPLFAQSTCSSVPTWSSCDFVFDLEPNEDPAHLELRAEFRSPRHRTFLMYAFRDADRRFVIRFSPTETGDWIYRLTSNLPRFEGKEVHFNASESDSPGFVRVANV